MPAKHTQNVMQGSTGHEADHGDLVGGFAVDSQAFVVFGKVAISTDPGEGSISNPAFGKGDESFHVRGRKNGLQKQATVGFHPIGCGTLDLSRWFSLQSISKQFRVPCQA